MSNQVIIFTNQNGGVSVCYPTGEMSIQQVLDEHCPDGAIIVDHDILPVDDVFFDAWELNNGVVSENLSKAKNIKKEKLRIERAPLLQAQDVAFQRALETGADTTAIVAEKQRLRDITQLADQATTIEQLKQISVEQ
jgi:hypothetical protein